MQLMTLIYAILIVIGLVMLAWLHSDSGKRFLSDDY